MKLFYLILAFLVSTTTYAQDVEVTRLDITGDSSGSLNNKYIYAYQPTAVGGERYCFHIKVDGLSHSSPCTTGDIVISVNIQPNDSAENVGFAFQIGIFDFLSGIEYEEYYKHIGITNVNDEETGMIFEYMMIYAFSSGVCTDASAGNTGWSVTVLTQGTD